MRKYLHLTFLLVNAYCGYYSCVQVVTQEMRPMFAKLAISKYGVITVPDLLVF